MHLRLCALLAVVHNCLAWSSPTPLGAMLSATVVPGVGMSGISATRTTWMTISPTSEISAPISTTTAPPLTYNRFGFRRQECFNDQGFRVNCATWTGYYYTWGPPGNPYEGGPGEGGGGGSGYTTVIVGASGGASTILPPLILWLTPVCVILAIAIL
jgi:uncharacterized membrane protein